MKLYLFFCVSLTLVYCVSTRTIASQKNEETSDPAEKKIEYTRMSPQNLKPYRENIAKLLQRTTRICKSPLLYWRNSCFEAFRQGPCQRGSIIYSSNNENVPRCMKNPCRKDGWVPYRGICQALGKQGSCAPNQVLGVEKTTLKIECIRVIVLLPHTRRVVNRFKRKVGLRLMFIAQAPVIRTTTTQQPPCPPGSQKNKVGQCRKIM